MSSHPDPSHPSAAPVQMFCRTCRHALNSRMLAGRIEYRHAEQLSGTEWDHPASPATAAELGTVVLVCDFCSAPDPSWIYIGGEQETDVRIVTAAVVDLGDYRRRHGAARVVRADTEMGPLQQWGARWTACHGCAALIDARDLYGLITRVVDAKPAKYRRGNRLVRLRGDLQGLYAPLFATLQPGRTPITDEYRLGTQEPPHETT